MDVFSLVAKLTLDSSEYDKNLDKSQEKASTFGDKMKTAFKVGGAAIAVVSTATSAMTTAFVKGASDVAVYGDNVDKMSQKMGMSTDAYQEWDFIMQHNGTTIESLQAGMKTLANAVENGNDAFERLGITEEDIASMNNEELFSAVIAGLQSVEDETERTYLAGQVLGRGATELGPLLNMTGDELETMRQQAHDLNGVMSEETVKASAAYQDSLQNMQTAFSGLQRGMMSEFLPSITTVMDGLAELFSGGDGLDMISDGVSQFVDKLSGAALHVLEVGSRIILALGEAVAANLPVLIEAGTNAILTLATGIVEQLPVIVNAGLQVIVSIANGIAENLPELTPTIVDVVLQIVDTLTEPSTLENLVNAALEIMLALSMGLIEAIPELIEKAPQIITNLVEAFIENAPKVLEAALKIVTTFAGGMMEYLGEKIADIGEAVGGWFDEHIVQPVAQFLDDIWSKIEEFFEPLIKFVSPILEALQYLFETIWTAIKIIVSRIMDSVSEKITKIWNSIKSFISEKILEPIKIAVGTAFSALYDLVKEPLEKVKTTVTGIFDDIKSVISGIVDKAKTWGTDLIDNFVNGIKSKIDSVAQAITSVADKIRDLIGFSEPKKGPLSNFHTFAPDMMKLFAQGIRDNEKLVTDQIEKSFDFGTRTVDFAASAAGRTASGEVTAGFGGYTGASTAMENPTIINITWEMDGAVLARKMYRHIKDESFLRGGAFA